MKKRPKFRLGLLLLIFLPLLPIFLAGFVYLREIYDASSGTLDVSRLSDAIYGAIRIYSLEVLNRNVTYANLHDWPIASYIMLEIARWMATTAILLTVYRLLKSTFVRLKAWLIALSRYSYALHGDKALVSLLKKKLGMQAISADVPEKFQATNHILAFRDSKSLYAFLDAHYEQLIDRKHAHVFICMNETIHSAQLDRRMVISDMTKNCARQYWKTHPLRAKERRVAIIGMGNYGRQLLTQALQVNLFFQEREIAYHIFGDDGTYAAMHPQLGQAVAIGQREEGRDSVFFHDKRWCHAQDILAQADRIILCADEEADNLHVMDYLLEHGLCSQIYVKVNRACVIKALWRSDVQDAIEVIPFGTDEELYTIEQVTHAALNVRAQLAHAYYFHRACVSGASNPVPGCPACSKNSSARLSACLDCPKFDASWNALSAYKRSSSMAQDDHADVKIRELLGEDLRDAGAYAGQAYEAFCRLQENEKHALRELEHRRWMRFLLLHGWKYGPVRDDEKRIHPLLVPFEELSLEEQLKDENAYLILAEIGHHLSYHKEMIDHL